MFYIFFNCSGLVSVTIRKAVPLSITEGTFSEETYQNATLYVPKGRDAYYRESQIWELFRKIEGIDMSDVYIDDSPFYNIQTNQMILGYYTSNDSTETGINKYRINGSYYKACIGFDKKSIRPFTGNTIINVRFALLSTSISEVKIWIGSSRYKEALFTQEITTLKVGWNEVKLEKPFEISEDSLFIGLMYNQDKTGYPISCVSKGSEKGSCYFYGPDDNGDYFWDEEYNKSLCIQCLVEGTNLPQFDIHTVNLILDKKYYKKGDQVEAQFSLRNWGLQAINEYEIDCLFDGTNIATIKEGDLSSPQKNSAIISQNCSFYVPENTQTGWHNVTVCIKSINGEKPFFSDDDSCNIMMPVYINGMVRQKLLLQHYANTEYIHPGEDSSINDIMSTIDGVHVRSHYNDQLSCPASEEYYKAFYRRTTYFDRYALGGQLISNFWEDVPIFTSDQAILQPSFANVNIEASYDQSSKILGIKVYGQKCEEFDQLIGSTSLTVLLTEDNVVCPQKAGNEYVNDYVHDGVLRTNVSAIWGDSVIWDGDRYENNYSIRLDNSWVKDNMKIVAFLGKPFNGSNYDELHVVNCNDFPLKYVNTKQPISHVVVVEEFTATRCNWCTRGILGLDLINEEFGNKVITIAAHSKDFMDPMYTEDYDFIFKRASGYPGCIINRGSVMDPYYGTSGNPFGIKDDIEKTLKFPVPGSIQATATWANKQKTVISIKTSTSIVVDEDDAPYQIGFILLEDGMRNTGFFWSQTNAYAGYSGEDENLRILGAMPDWISDIEYNHVAVAAWGAEKGITGSIKAPLRANATQTFTYTADISTNELIQDKSRLSVVALLLDKNTGRIYNAHLTMIGKGDVNGDGTVNAADIVEVVNYIMGNPSAIFDESAADLNGDGTVNAADVVLMVNTIMATQ